MNAVHPLFTSLMRFTSQAAWVEVRRWKCDLRGISCCRPVLLLFHSPFHASLFWLYLILFKMCALKQVIPNPNTLLLLLLDSMFNVAS